MKKRKTRILMIALVIMIQTIIFIILGVNKSYIHMDEAYSYGLSNYKQVEIQANQDFYNQWHGKNYYEDYLSLQEEDLGKWNSVYENQKNDVHPPFYYLLLRKMMEISIGKFSVWPGILLNIIIYAFITIITYLILRKIGKSEKNSETKSLILAFVSSLTLASLTNVIYIRMYALSTLNILITSYLHILLLDKKNDKKILLGIGISALIGSLTHYYYLFFLFMLFWVMIVKFLKEKNFNTLRWYIGTMIVSAVLSLIIFPYSIEHMFFGYRGEGVIGNLSKAFILIKNLFAYLWILNYYGFNFLLILILIITIVLIVYKRKKNIKTKEKNKYCQILVLPTLFYFVLASIASPWITLRYILPVCGLIFILVIYYLYQLLGSVLEEKKQNIIIGSILGLMLLSPILLKLEPQELYRDRKEIVDTLKTNLNLPTIYVFNSGHNRFLDDILLFSILDESYIAKDMELTSQAVNNIVKDKNLSHGIILFINEGQAHNPIIEKFQKTLHLNNVTHLKRLNACNVYYLF